MTAKRNVAGPPGTRGTRDLSGVRNERGLSESIQHAVVFPALMLATLGVIQTGIWVHGHTVAARAAAAGVDIARGTQGSAAQAREATARLADAGGLQDITVEVRRSGTEAEVIVHGRAALMLDLGLARIDERASAPLERVTMEQAEILERAIRQAIAGGWQARVEGNVLRVDSPRVSYHGRSVWGSPDIIYSHDFAKALWGEEKMDWATSPSEFFINYEWQYHLAQMVVAPDPIAYLRDNMPTAKS